MADDDNKISQYDRLVGKLDGLTGVTHTRPSTVRSITPLIGNAETWIVTTYRVRNEPAEPGEHTTSEDIIALEMVSAGGSLRLALPPKVANAIARQRESLTAQSRSRAAKAQAQGRKDRGVVPFAGKVRAGA